MEINLLLWIQGIRTPFLDSVLAFITHLGSGGFVWILVSFYYLFVKKDKKTGVSIILALTMVLIICLLIIKPAVARTRPFDIYKGIELAINAPKDYSFPSGHTASSIACITVLYRMRKKSFIPFLMLAILISFSRMYLFVHYPSDILFGALFGVLFGYISVNIVNKKFKATGGVGD